MNENQKQESAGAETSPEQKLAAVYKRLLITVICCCIGWPIFLYAFNHSFNPLMMLLGGAIVSAPLLFIMLRGGGLKDIFKTDEYEVITTYSNGRKESDGGFESGIMGLITKIIGAVLLIVIGCFVTIGLLVYMIIKYFILYNQVKEKPSFIKSAFPIIIVGLVVLIGSGIIFNVISIASRAG